MSKQGLEDAMSLVDANAAFGVPVDASGDDAVLSQLEAKLSGEPSQETPNEDAEIAEKIKAKIDPDEEASEDTTDEMSEDSTEDVDDSEEEETTEDEAEKEEAEDETDDAEDEDIYELSEEQLCDVLGLPEKGVQIDEEGSLRIRTKVDGEERYVPLPDLVSSYQLEKHVRNESSAVAAEKREFQEFKTVETGKLNEAVTSATALVHALETQLMAEYAPEAMQQLRQTNPAEYAAKSQDAQLQFNKIQQIKQGIGATIREQQKQEQEAQATAREAYITEQTKLLVEAIPAWADNEVAKRDLTELQRVIIEDYGFTAEEFNNVNDHRMFKLMRAAAKGAAVSDTTPLKKKLKKKKIPKLVKASSRKTVSDAAERKRTQQKKQQVKLRGGDTQSIANVLVDRI